MAEQNTTKKTKVEKKVSYADMNKQRVERLLERDPAAVKAVIANTIETKKISEKLTTLDTIFTNCRRNVGYSVSFDDFSKISEKFNKILESIDAVIDTAEELKVFTPYSKRGDSKFKTHKPTIIKMLAEEKTIEDIAKAIGEKPELVTSWVSSLKTTKK